MTAPSSDPRAVNAFLRQLAADRNDGRQRDLAEYQALWPHAADKIAVEFAALGTTRTGSAPEPAPAEAPTRFGPFMVHKKLGSGGQGTVYLATDLRLHRSVALKVLTGLGSLHGESQLRFRREAELASRLDHPGICTVYESGDERGIPYISMRYVEGRTLAQAGAATPSRLPIDAALALIEDAARALHVAHEAGVIHRDIKPGNIMIQPDGRPVILDFGLARDLDETAARLTATSAIVGTPNYMSPEQLILPAREIDRRSDVYSLGATLFELVAGRPPHEAPTREALYHAILSEDVSNVRRRNPAATRDLAAVIAVVLEKDRDRRYQTALALAEDLGRVRRSEPILARPSGPWTRLLKWRRRNPALAAAVVLLFASLVAGLGVSLHYLRKAESALSEYNLLAGATKLAQLETEADALWPARPEMVPPLRSWIGRAEVAAGRLPVLEAALDDLERTGDRDDSATAFKLDTLGRYVAELRAFASDHPERGRLALVRRRCAFAEEVETKTIVAHEAAWKEAARFVAASPAYRGLALVPQIGLIPIGPDPASGFYEFVDLQTAPAEAAANPIPVRDATGRLPRRDLGVVFVLVPGGTFVMGAVKPDVPHAPDVPVDREFWGNEHPDRVTLAPFFISKYELAQAQWTRIAGRDPSFFRSFGDPETLWDHRPVENVNFDECSWYCGRLGWSLPTEAQWEYAARGGTLTPWSCGRDRSSLQGFANVAGLEQTNQFDPHVTVNATESWNDEIGGPANVAWLEPNPFGLHHVHGNVWEWCLDPYSAYEVARPREGDGLHEPRSANRVFRGGSWLRNASAATSSYRLFNLPSYRRNDLGFRPARRLQPAK